MKSSATFIFAILPILLSGQEALDDVQLIERLQEIQARAEKLHQKGEEAFGQFCHGPSATVREKLTEDIRQLERKVGETADGMLNRAQLVRTRLQRLNAARESEPAKKIDRLVAEYHALNQQVDQQYGRHLLDRHQLIESARNLTDAEADATRRLSQLRKRYAAVPVPGTAIGKLKHQAVQDLIEEAKDSLRDLRRAKSSLVRTASRMARGYKGIESVRQTVKRGMRTVRLLGAQQTDLLLWQYCIKLGSPQVIVGAARGKVSIKNEMGDTTLVAGATCAPGSQITTGKGEYCWLYIPYNKLVELGPESEFRLPTEENPRATLVRGTVRLLGVLDINLPSAKDTITCAGDVLLNVDGPHSKLEVARHSELGGQAASWFKKATSPTSWMFTGEQPKSKPGSEKQLAALRRQLRGMPYELSEESRPTDPEEPRVNVSKTDAPSDSGRPKLEAGKENPAKSDIAPSFAPE